MPYKPREIESKLLAKFGFGEAREHSSDHRWYELRLSGLPPILTKVSHSREPLSSTIESKIARQLRVQASFFRGMIDCTHDRQDYERQVREDPHPPFEIRF